MGAGRFVKIVVGLGNPGDKYAQTRHNIGWMVLDRLAERAGWGGGRERDASRIVWGRFRGLDLTLAKPLTYMNLSGDAVRLLLNAYLESPAEMIVVYDEVDLPLGKLRILPKGSAGTHNGMRSIISEIGTENFPRLRIGIGVQERGRLRDYVLDEFSADEEPIVEDAVQRSVDALVLFARGDLKRAMNEFTRDKEAP